MSKGFGKTAARLSVSRKNGWEKTQARVAHLDAEEHLLDGDGRPPVLVLVEDAVACGVCKWVWT